MKILSISRAFFWNMGEKAGVPSMYLPMKGLVEAGHEVHHLYPAGRSDKPSEVIDDIHVHRYCLPFDWGNETEFYNRYAEARFKRLKMSLFGNLRWLFFNIAGVIQGFKVAKDSGADIIYAHGEHTAFIAYIISRLISRPFIVRIYGLGGLYWEMGGIISKIKNFRSLLPFKLPADNFIIIKDGNNSHLVAQEMGVPQEKITHWRNGVDFNIYNPLPEVRRRVRYELGIRDDQPIILTVSRLAVIKRVDRLLTQLPFLFDKEKNSVCVVAGDGYERFKLENICESLGIKERVIFTGAISRDKVVDLYNAADIFVTLADHSNCGNTLWEAMACAKCVVTLDNNDGTREVIESGHNGILLSVDELNNLHEILLSLLNDEMRRNKLGVNARKRVEELLESWDSRVEKEIRLLESIVT